MQKQKNQSKSNNPFPGMEEEVLDFWDKAKTFEKSVKRKALKGDYVFYDGPPFATGMPHYGHIVASLMKDVVPRYWTMKGYRVERRWGWDCHGLPVENLAEQELKLKDKTDIEKIGIEKFNQYCHSIVLRYAKEWRKVIKRIGRWVDMDNDYKTMEPNYMESIWWVFKSLWDKGLIYQGYKAMHICPRCGTTLSNFEVTQNYKDIKDISVTVKFRLEQGQKIGDFVTDDNTYILAWTTTPWTLIGNVALAVGEDIDYVILETTQKREGTVSIGGQTTSWDVKPGESLIFSKDYFGKLDAHYLYGKGYNATEVNSDMLRYYSAQDEILEKYGAKKIQSSNLVGKSYKPLFAYFQDKDLENKENSWKIYGANFVSTEEGTGVVHIAPAFGEEDMELGKKKNLPFIQHVDGAGRLTKDVKDWPGEEVKPIDNPKATDKKIVDWLKKKGKLFSTEEYEHSYPHCWRCETPLLNYATKSWFVEVTKIKEDLIKNNKKIHWVPEHIKEGRFGKWLEEARDWAISRNRYWGAPLPIWSCDKCDEKAVVGSRQELKKISGQKVDDLHKQFVDKITWKCSKCDGAMERIPEVLDCWFESGAMPYAQEHYPFENKKKFEKNFPAHFIGEGVDQTRGWFYTLMVLSTALFNKEVARNIIANGIVLAEDGQKMSKKLNNYPDPGELFEKYSVDAMRYYLLSSPVLLAENLNFSEDGVKETLRKVEMILWNVYKFYEMYTVKPTPNPSKEGNRKEPKSKNILDKWIIGRLNQLIDEVTENMDNYVIPKAIRPIEEFINDLSTWYLRRSRDRFKGEDEQDKEQALETTRYVLLQLSKVMAPFMPFIAEQLWQKVTENDFKDKNKSVHLEEWPCAEENEDQKVDNIGILNAMEVTRRLVEEGLAKRDEAGIKTRQPLSSITISSLNDVFKAICNQAGDQAGSKKYFAQFQKIILDELNIKAIKSVKNENSGNMIEVVDINKEITPELKQEGIKREVVRFINAMRKNAGMTIQDKAHIYWQTKDKFTKKAISENTQDIKKDTLASEMDEGKSDKVDLEKEVKVNGIEVWLGIKKV